MEITCSALKPQHFPSTNRNKRFVGLSSILDHLRDIFSFFQGFVVGFMASKIFCLHFSTMKTIDVPQVCQINHTCIISIYWHVSICVPTVSPHGSVCGEKAIQVRQFPIVSTCFTEMNRRDAYRIACLGVTEEDWRLLALEAFEVSYFSSLTHTLMWSNRVA